MVEAVNIGYRIGGKRLIDGISCSFEPGKLHLIVGPNGAGKTTFLKILSGQLRPSEGNILFNKRDLQSFTVRQLAQRRAVLSQNIALSFPLTVEEVVMMGRYPYFTGTPGLADLEICKEMLERFGLTDLKERDYMKLSGGEQQRVHFARIMAQTSTALSDGPSLLLLDEPLTFLDIQYQYHFMQQLVASVKKENIVVIGIVHDLNLAAKFADRIYIIGNGQLTASGSVAEALTVDNITTAFKLKPVIFTHDGQTVLTF